MGELLWDMLPDGKKVGGAPANFANHIANLGLNGLIVSAVGNDSLGNEILDSLKISKAKLAVAQTTYPTGTVNVHLDGNGIPSYEICENTAWDNIPFTPELEEIARQTRAVCFGSLAQRSSVSRNTIERFLDAMPADSLKIFDINLRQNYYSKEIISNSLKRCDIFKINDEELEIVKQLFQIEIEDAEECWLTDSRSATWCSLAEQMAATCSRKKSRASSRHPKWRLSTLSVPATRLQPHLSHPS